MDRISKKKVGKLFHSQRQQLADDLNISINHVRNLIKFGDKGDTTRSKHAGTTLNGHQFRQWVNYIRAQGFSTDTALCMARYGIGAHNFKSRGDYFFEYEGALRDHDEINWLRYRRMGR